MSKDVDLTRRFRGLNVKQVDEHLKNLKQIYTKEISDIKQQIEKSLKEKDRLYQKLLNLQAEKEKQKKSKELLDLALIRAKEAVSFIENKAEEESEEIWRAAKHQNEIYEEKINDIDNDLKITKMQVGSLLQDIMKILQDSRTEKEKEETLTGKVVGKILPVNSSRLRNKTIEDRKESQAGKPNSEVIVEDKGNIPEENEKKMTADGAVVTEYNKSKEDAAHHYKRFAEKIARTFSNPATWQEKPARAEPEEEPDKREFLGEEFWENCSEAPAVTEKTFSAINPVVEMGNYINFIGSAKTKEIDILAAVQETVSTSVSASAVEGLLSDDTPHKDCHLEKRLAVAVEMNDIRPKLDAGE